MSDRYKAVHLTDGKWHVVDEEGESIGSYEHEWEANGAAHEMNRTREVRFGPRRARRAPRREE